MSSHAMNPGLTVLAKYVYLDVVGFTRDRSDEGQIEVVHKLNSIVLDCIREFNVPKENLILLPTGDGICICLIKFDNPEAHILIALGILKRLEEHNSKTTNPDLKFQVRIGINSNEDNLIIDINDRPNMAGVGINMAQRVMSLAGGNQIIFGQQVFGSIGNKTRYRNHFKKHSARVKHGLPLEVFQLVDSSYPGLNTECPPDLRPTEPAKPPDTRDQITARVWYYMAHAVRHRNLLKKFVSQTFAEEGATMFLWMLATDSAEWADATDISPISVLKTWGAQKPEVPEKQLLYYMGLDMWISSEFKEMAYKVLYPFKEFFEQSWTMPRHFVNAKGIEVLRDTQPEWFEKFPFSDQSS